MFNLKNFWILLVPFLLFSYGIILSKYEFKVVNDLGSLNNKNRIYHDYQGVTHVHSKVGVGRDTQIQIIKEANKASLDFIIFTDLNQKKSNLRLNGYQGKTLVLSGAMYRYLDSKLLYYPMDQKINFKTLAEIQEFFTDNLTKKRTAHPDELIILAHPFKNRTTWKAKYSDGLDGIEVINLKSIWQQSWEHSPIKFVLSALIFPFNNMLSLLKIYNSPKRELELFDSLSQKNKVVGLLGNHATAQLKSIFGKNLNFPTYEQSFLMASNHVLLKSELTGNVTRDNQKILTAISSGQLYFSIDAIGDPKGFECYVKDSSIHPMGSEIKLSNKSELYFQLPEGVDKELVEVMLFKNGNLINTISKSKNGSFKIKEEGVYRLEVSVKLKMPIFMTNPRMTWIYSNPFYISKH